MLQGIYAIVFNQLNIANYIPIPKNGHKISRQSSLPSLPSITNQKSPKKISKHYLINTIICGMSSGIPNNSSISNPKTSSQSSKLPKPNSGNSDNNDDSNDEIDIYRDTMVRYLGYANEIGESFRPLIHVNFVRLSYCVSFGYVFADTFDKIQKASLPNHKGNCCGGYETRHSNLFGTSTSAASIALESGKTEMDTHTKPYVNKCMIFNGVDTLVWQSFASVIVPGFTINRIVKMCGYSLRRMNAAPLLLKLLPTATGLLSIPFIVHPIDGGVHWVLDHSLRPALRSTLRINCEDCEEIVSDDN